MSLPAAQAGSSQRKIGLRVRGDLLISTTLFQGETSWIVKDPISLKYFRLREAEYEAFCMIDGENSYEDIKAHLARKYPNKKFDVRQLQHLVQSLHQSGLLLSDAEGQAQPLNRRRRKERNQKVIQTLSSIVSIRFPGFDPEPILSWLYPKISWLFSAAATLLFLGVIAAALLLVGSNLDEFRNRLPEFQQFFGFKNLFYMGFILIFTKTIHEFGHGLMCKHFKGECHEMGFMLMVLTPAMYCDTSDSWILPNKWHRIAIGAAGMWVEVVMAAFATFVWWYTHPGWLHYLALNIMFLSSVATIMFNINPLLRYDGYYMLSDLLEIPNLSQKANLALTDRLKVWCLGMEPVSARRLPERQQFAFSVYAVSSFFYRWFVMATIFWFITRIFEPYGLQIIGYLAVGIAVAGSVIMPLYKGVQYFLYPGRLREVKKERLVMSACVLGVLLAAFFFLPLPHHVRAPFVVRPADAESVFVNWPGTLGEVHAQHGDEVSQGQVIARLRDPDLEIKVEELRGELARQEALLVSYRVRDDDPLELARLSGEAKANIVRLKRQLTEQEQQLKQLELTANRAGTIIPPPNTPDSTRRTGAADITLASWAGTPLEPQNVSALLDRETLVCYVGDPNNMRAMLCIPQSEVKLMKADQPAKVTFNSFRGESRNGTVVNVGTQPVEILPRELSTTNGGTIAAKPQPNGAEAPMLTHFEVAIELNDKDLNLLPGMTGRASVRVGASPLAARVYRSLSKVFKFK